MAALVVLAIFSVNTARAVDYHVATAQALQNALFLAANNGVNNNIYLTNGYYSGNFSYNSSGTNNLTLLAEPGLTNTAVTIDGAGVGRGLNILSSASTNTITIQGISFSIDTGNYYDNIAALSITAGVKATISVSNCLFFSPTNGLGLGGVALEITSGLNATLIGCTVTGLGRYSGCGVDIGFLANGSGAGKGVTGNITVRNCAFSNCQSLSPSSAALTIGGPAASITIANSSFTGNIGGPGVLIYEGDAIINLAQNTFNSNGNVDSAYDGAVQIIGNSAVTLTGNAFTTNQTGGVVLFDSQNVTLTGNTFLGNGTTNPVSAVAEIAGGGVSVMQYYINYDDTGVYYTTNVTITGNSFIGNSASTGGAAYVNVDLTNTTVTVQANTFKQNTSSGSGSGGSGPAGLGNHGNGGAIYITAPTITVSDNLVAGNAQTSSAETGGGVWVDASSTLFFINNTITANTSAGGGGGAAFQVDNSVAVLNVFNNIIWGNSGTSGADVWLAGTGKERIFSNNDADGIFGVWDLFENDLDIDPQFVAPANGDYHLLSTSPCHNAGTITGLPLPALDLDGNPRTVANMIDMGCYQFLLRLQILPTTTNSFVLQWPSTAGQTYEIDRSTNLAQGFQVLMPSIQATPPTNQISTPAVQGANSAFYRITVTQ